MENKDNVSSVNSVDNLVSDVSNINLSVLNGHSSLHPVDHHPLEPVTVMSEEEIISQTNAQTRGMNTHEQNVDTYQLDASAASDSITTSIRTSSPPIRSNIAASGHRLSQSKPSSPVHETILCGDVLTNWIHCICVVTFDIELGQAIEKIYPPNVNLTEKEKSNICYLSFPDSNSGCMGDTQFHFRTRTCPVDEVPSVGSPSSTKTPSRTLTRKKSCSVFSNEMNQYNESCLSSLQVDESHYYGFVYFRQTKDPSVKRGYFQKSLVLISKLPFITLYKTIVSIIANEYFETNNFKIVEDVCHEIDSKWPSTPMVTTSGLELSLLNKVIHVKIPKRDETLTSLSGNGTQTMMMTAKEEVSRSGNRNNFHVSLSSPSLMSMNELEIKSRNEDLLYSNRPLTSQKIESEKIYLSSPHEINYFKCFFPNLINDIQFIWELVITCEPIIVMAPTPDVTCEIVESLVHCIQPLKYVADFRPFFTIHDSEFKEYTSTNAAPPPAILGVTNPFFAKTLQHWPNIIRIGEYVSMSPLKKRILSPPKGLLGKNTTFDTTPGIHSKVRPFLVKDKSLCKKIIERIDKHRPSEVHSAFLKKFFTKLTINFLEPLDKYLMSLIPLNQVTPFKPLPRLTPFNPDDFFKTLTTSCGTTSGSSGNIITISGIKGDWIGLYKKFFRCPNFSKYFETKFNELETNLKQLHIKSIFEADLLNWIKNKTEIEIIDLILILKNKIIDMKQEQLTNCPVNQDHVDTQDDQVNPLVNQDNNCKEEVKNINEAIKKTNHEHIIKLNSLLSELIQKLPPDLHPILNK